MPRPLPLSLPAFVLYLSCLVFFTACLSDEADRQGRMAEKPFFDLAAFMDAEASHMDSLGGPWQKRTLIDGKEEIHTFDSLPWKDELDIFRRCDINRPAWRERYVTDSIFAGQRLSTIRYAAIDSTLNIRQLEVRFVNGRPAKVSILKIIQSRIIRLQQQLNYQSGLGYHIINEQKLPFSEKTRWEITVCKF